MNADPSDLPAIDDAMAQLFAAFDNRAGRYPDMTPVRALLLPEARIVMLRSEGADIMDVESFVAPREARLAAGVFAEFHEWEARAETTIFGGAAVRRCTYRKEGLRDGVAVAGGGFKVVSFVKLAGAWRVASIVWQDEGEGLDLDQLAL